MYPDLEIISLHIPKTGGASFVNFMKEVFGGENVIRFRKLNYRIENSDWTLVEKNDRERDLKTEAGRHKVLHGHFQYNEIEDIHKNSNAKVITWVRDPVERVVSRYFYLQRTIRDEPNHFQKEKKDMGLLEFAELPSQRNVMSRYVDGISIENLFFIGVLEYHDQSIEEFKQLFNITAKVLPAWDNKNLEYKSQYSVSDDEKRSVMELNSHDVELYNKVLRMKGIME